MEGVGKLKDQLDRPVGPAHFPRDRSAGFGTAVLPRSLTEREGPAVDVRPLRPAIRLPVALLWRRDRRLSPAARTFVEYVRAAEADGTP